MYVCLLPNSFLKDVFFKFANRSRTLPKTGLSLTHCLVHGAGGPLTNFLMTKWSTSGV